jgi:hypothetical protein
MDKREEMANQLLMRGHATIDALLEASFGEWPPRGLDIIHNNPQTVALTAAARLDDGTGDFDGMAISERRELFFHPSLSPAALLTTLAHETAHVLQHEAMLAERTPETYGFSKADGIAHLLLNYSALSPLAAPALQDREQLMGTLQENLAAMSGQIGSEVAAHLRQGFSAADSAVVSLALDHAAYLAEPVEIQARLQQALADGYQHWGRMPVTPRELYAALVQCGLDINDALRAALLPDDAQTRQALADFAVPPRDRPGYIQDLNRMQKMLQPTARAALWQTAFPAQYGLLLEFYGDRLGGRRMNPAAPTLLPQARQRVADDTRCLLSRQWKKAVFHKGKVKLGSGRARVETAAALRNLGIKVKKGVMGEFIVNAADIAALREKAPQGPGPGKPKPFAP